MGKNIKALLTIDENTGDASDHLSDEEIACLAEGTVEETRRPALLRHVNRCPECHEILQQTLIDLEADAAEIVPSPNQKPWWRGKQIYTLAASIVVVVMVGLVYNFFSASVLTVPMDKQMRQFMLEEGGTTRWTDSERLERFTQLLRQHDVKVGRLKEVRLAAEYSRTKAFLPPTEELRIRIEDGVAYVEVIQEGENAGHRTPNTE